MSGLCWPILGLCWPDLAADPPRVLPCFLLQGLRPLGWCAGGAFDEIEADGLVDSRRYWPKIAVMCNRCLQATDRTV